MTVVEKAQATGTLAQYATEIGNGSIVITDNGTPVAVLVPIENADLETVALSTNRQFIGLIERSRSRVEAEGIVSSSEMRRRLG